MYKVIIFDFFGVIYSEPYNAWLQKHGFTREGDFLEAAVKADSGQIEMAQFFDLLSSLSRQPAHEINKEFETVKRVNPDVIGLVKALKMNYRIGLLSNASSSFIREILDENDLEKYFDEIIVSSEAGYIKPNREIYEAALRILRINSSEAIFIDDNRLYIEGAQKIGLDGILFRSADQVARELLERNINFDL